ncbi:MAG: cation transporting ATPase C-terminal domain-containing protein, partial [Clostridiales bacterium]|nr:cation transporting ATPase C-terminal domain-containing protein [Clostridiales bacterium]
GTTSSIFDWTTYIFMYFIFSPIYVLQHYDAVSGATMADAMYNNLSNVFSDPTVLTAAKADYVKLFQTAWFVESMWSQTLVIHMIRTPKWPFIQSHASAPVTLATFTGIAVLTIIPYTPFGTILGMLPLPATYYLYLIPFILMYMLLATSLKKAYVKHYGELL